MRREEQMQCRLEHIKRHWGKVNIEEMKCLGFVSVQYTAQNLLVDEWYFLSRNDSHPTSDIDVVGGKAERSILFKMIIISMNDIKRRRPCDLGIWKKDMPPHGIDTCTHEIHICSKMAAKWLLETVGEEEERYVGLTPGSISSLMGNAIRKWANQ